MSSWQSRYDSANPYEPPYHFPPKRRIVLAEDILEQMDKDLESGKLIRVPGGFVISNPDYKDEWPDQD